MDKFNMFANDNYQQFLIPMNSRTNNSQHFSGIGVGNFRHDFGWVTSRI